ncbi:MAG: DUF3450 domain-containing protein [Alphaproteobacteria bacterium]|nr:MAG: DUF3450 domain-containing protein [Alphaproteobacteria bacterium]
MVNKLKSIAVSGIAIAAMCAGTALAQMESAPMEKLDQAIAMERENLKIAQASQQQVDKLSDEARDLLDKFRTVSRQIDDTRIYNAQLSKQIASQREELARLEESIAEVSLIRRQITPLMLEMIDTLESFVKNDLPFRRDQRLDRVAELRSFMDRGDISAAEQFRQILETYQKENEFGRTVENFTGSVMHGGEERQVEFLRIGRIFLGYKAQEQDTDIVGVWDRAAGDWRPLDGSYARVIEAGLRFSKKQANPELLVLPVPAPEAR